MEERIIKELSFYRLREIEIEDMKLKIEELQIGEQLGAMNYEERVQTSMSCKNNDYVMNQIETLNKKIRLNEILNKRIDNSLRRLNESEKKIIVAVYIDKNSISMTSRKLYKSRKSVKKTLENALKKMILQ